MANDENLAATDGYDATSIVDDVAPDVADATGVPTDVAVKALRKVVAAAQRLRLPPASVEVEPASGDVGEVPVRDAFEDVLGGDEREGFSPASSDLAVSQELYRKYKSAATPPKIVRVDTDASYTAWKDGNRQKYVDDLESRLSALENELTAHEADHHGGGRVARIEEALAKHLAEGHPGAEVLGAELDRARDRALVCGDRVPLSLPPGASKKIAAWQDGDQIFCSVRLPGADGKARIATTATPVQRHVEEVVSYAEAANVDPFEVMGVLPTLAQVLGGASLVTQMCGAASQLLARPEVQRGEVFVGMMRSTIDPGVAAIMELAQRAVGGDQRALAELYKIDATEKGSALIKATHKNLRLARASKEQLQ